ncbi:MAG: hydroxymethylbilane synthase, partial [Pseudomonadota bacterium]
MKAPQPVRIGTRGSPLALYQAELIAREIEQASDGAQKGEIVPFTTKGDQLTSERLINSGGKGLFTREIDRAVDEGEVEIGVHSLKDVPSVLPDGQALVAYPARVDPRDGFLTTTG